MMIPDNFIMFYRLLRSNTSRYGFIVADVGRTPLLARSPLLAKVSCPVETEQSEENEALVPFEELQHRPSQRSCWRRTCTKKIPSAE